MLDVAHPTSRPARRGSRTAPSETTPVKPRTPTRAPKLKNDTTLVTLLRDTVEAASGDDGWANLAAVGHYLTKRRPDFDSRTYGYARLTDLITATTLFEVDRRLPGDGKPAVVYIRDRRRPIPEQTVAATGPQAGANTDSIDT
jgi:hypothetical protein